MVRSRLLILGIALLIASGTSGCLYRTRKVEVFRPSSPLKEAGVQDLVSRINSEAGKVRTMNATVDIATSVGSAKCNEVTDYTDIRGYILLRQPDTLRMIGLLPVVRTTAFDMVSDGRSFRLSVPPRSKFVIGPNEVIKPSENPLENLRPQAILEAMMLRGIDMEREVYYLEQATEPAQDPQSKKMVEMPVYVINVISRIKDDGWRLARKIYFSRVTLQPMKQVIYDAAGAIQTVSRYEQFQMYDGLFFPSVIEITRPQEQYNIRLSMVKLKLNEALRDDQFILNQPEGAQLVDLAKPETNPKPLQTAQKSKCKTK